MKNKKPRTSKGSRPCEATARGTFRARNDAGWYSRAGVPAVGANFAVLQNIDVEALSLPNGMRLDTVHQNVCSVNIPVDQHQAFMQSMIQFYSEIREKNSGAANYSPMELAAYIMNLRSARAYASQALKMIAAMKTKMPGNVNSAAIMALAAGAVYYSSEVPILADLENELQIRLSDLEAFPVPPMACFARDDYVFRAVHLDSNSKKPSLMSYIPAFNGYWVLSGTKPDRQLDVVRTQFPDTVQHCCDAITQILQALNTPVNAILRGDILNAFGSAAMRRDLTPRIKQPLLVAVEDKELMSQNENAAILGIADNITLGAAAWRSTLYETTGDAVMELQFGGITQPKIYSRAELTERLINWHGDKPASDAEELAITRFDVRANKVNDTTNSRWDLVSADGIVLCDTIMLDGFAANGTDYDPAHYTRYGNLNQGAHGITPAAELKRLAFENKVMEHSPQYIVDENAPVGYFWNLDNFGVVTDDDLETYTVWSTKSQYMAPRPRGEMGRVESKA